MSLWNVEIKNGIAVASYVNPPMNYMTAAGMNELRDLIESWRDPAIRVVILTGGVPNRFITHYSVEELVASARDKALMMNIGRAWLHHHNATLTNLRDLPKPVIAAMSGSTMGGGFETSLSCDIRIAQAGDFRYGLPEVTLGILPGGCGTQRLSRLIGAGRAIDFILRGRICRPEEALSMGIVHEVATDAKARALEIATEMLSLSAVAIAESKRAVYEGVEVHLQGGLEIEGDAFIHTMITDEAVQIMEEYVAQPFEQRVAWLERKRALHHPR
ncbi:MAG: enoyl-CoA hydratase/isomerase family protein [Gammaproteobacteria bacterium]|nr:enoyl-CoA hydratase/isomerase family protein [Gammaproteobacteria bacterium]MBI5615281.1 enoyl-CoA hydratase/isomerase family protein [Gammaproteobacteria bacterium]